ncbi:DUF4157 domain-containing protein [Archangium violaceum]|nr:DUF4157 domain-containing protein [Archangium violaceum]
MPVQARFEAGEPRGHRLESAATFGARSGGSPLPDPVQRKMSAAFGQSFADVRVHHGPEAASIGARAFTRGSHLHFAPGKYAPGTPEGQRLIGHELTHVVQQRAGRVRVPQEAGLPVNSHPALESEADRSGALAAQGQPVAVSGVGSGIQPSASPAAGAIQCNGDKDKQPALTGMTREDMAKQTLAMDRPFNSPAKALHNINRFASFLGIHHAPAGPAFQVAKDNSQLAQQTGFQAHHEFQKKEYAMHQQNRASYNPFGQWMADIPPLPRAAMSYGFSLFPSKKKSEE